MSTRYDEVIATLGARIVHGELAPGSTLTLDSLCQDVGISRTIAREVVQVLSSMGLLRSRRRTGITVLPQEAWDVYDPAVIHWRLDGPDRDRHLDELSQLRAAIEPTAAGLAATHADDEVREELVGLAEAMEERGAAGDLATFLEHDVRFHRLLLTSSGNPMFAALAPVVEEVLRGRTDHHLMPPRPKPVARALHAEVARAVAGSDAATATSAMTVICQEAAAGIAEMAARDRGTPG